MKMMRIWRLQKSFPQKTTITVKELRHNWDLFTRHPLKKGYILLEKLKSFNKSKRCAYS